VVNATVELSAIAGLISSWGALTYGVVSVPFCSLLLRINHIKNTISASTATSPMIIPAIALEPRPEDEGSGSGVGDDVGICVVVEIEVVSVVGVVTGPRVCFVVSRTVVV
jgi:hypothetical protein